MRITIVIFCCFTLCFGAQKAGNSTNTQGHGDGKGKDQKSGGGHKTHWGYEQQNGPDLWATFYPESCGTHLKRQSPIDLQLAAAKYDDSLVDVDLLTQAATDNYTIVNNGHTVNIVVSNDILVSGGGLPEGFKVHSFHFHWGATDSVGSEHTTDGRSYPLEMHIVTFNAAKHASIVHALKGSDSIAVLGTFWEVGAENPALNHILDNLPKVQSTLLTNTKGTKASIKAFDVKPLLPKLTKNFYRYLGSLTTPTCNEVVVWTVFENTNTLSKEQMEKFRQLAFEDDHGMQHKLANNYRPVQNLNGRVVSRSFSVANAGQPANKANPVRSNNVNNAAHHPVAAAASLLITMLYLISIHHL